MKTTRGFTLVELTLVIVLIGLLSGVAIQIVSGNFWAYFTSKTISELSNKTNIAADNLMRELHSAKSISTIAANGMTFVNQSGQTIVIALSGTTMTRSVNGGTAQTLCDQVSSLTLAYFNQAGATTATATSVRFVSMNITTTDNSLPYSIITGTVIRPLLA